MSPLFDIEVEHVYTLKLPWPPSINDYYGTNFSTGAKYIKKKGRDFRAAVVEILKPYMEDRKSLSQRLQVWVEAYPPDRRRRDLDNLKKALLDALTHAGVYEDDCLIDDLRTVRGEKSDSGGYVRVYVNKIKDE